MHPYGRLGWAGWVSWALLTVGGHRRPRLPVLGPLAAMGRGHQRLAPRRAAGDADGRERDGRAFDGGRFVGVRDAAPRLAAGPRGTGGAASGRGAEAAVGGC